LSLRAPAVKEFVVQLFLVSKAEISAGTYDHTDLTQVAYRQKHALLNSKATAAGNQFHRTQPNKLVEATHYNMASRPRLIFADLWIIVADHLTEAALHSNAAIAMYAVNSFRQLCIQYLQRDELEVFEFQRRFLKSLETVMARSRQTSTKELLLNCVAQLIHVFGSGANKPTTSPRPGGLRSGWVLILAILGLCGID
jgi:Sec7-like guanine-nucleotide exchange factor